MVGKKQLDILDLCCVRQQKKLFTNLSFQLLSSQALVIEGANGSGKSSLLRLLTGLTTPTQGDICWQGISIQQHNEQYKRDLHYVGHTNGIKLGLTVIENLRLSLSLALEKQALSFEDILDQLQLSAHAHTFASHLSAGQKRRLALAKLLLFPKPLWLLDEPLTALDSHTQQLFLSWLDAHLKQDGIAIMSSHQTIKLKDVALTTLRLSSC